MMNHRPTELTTSNKALVYLSVGCHLSPMLGLPQAVLTTHFAFLFELVGSQALRQVSVFSSTGSYLDT